VNGNWQSVVFNMTREVSVNSTLDPCIETEPDDIILDNVVDISAFNSKFLHEVKPCEDVNVHSIGGLSMVVNKTGYLDGFFRVHSSDTTKINVLSYAECEDKYRITCLHGEGFIIHTDERDILFTRVGILYVAKWDALMGEARSYVTSQETESMYMKRESAHQASL
jgi:hypothetical protein